MTRQEMISTAKHHWYTNHRKMTRSWTPQDFSTQAEAAADLTRMEMDSLILIGLDERTAWAECKHLFCLAPPPDLSR